MSCTKSTESATVDTEHKSQAGNDIVFIYG